MIKNHSLIKDVVLVFVFSRILFYTAVLIAPSIIPEYSGNGYLPWHSGAPSLIDASWRWDAGWYASIIREGYSINAEQSNVAFFPLFPLLIKTFLLVIPHADIFMIGVLISNLCFFLALLVIWKYVEFQFGQSIARRTIFLLSIFPVSFFFSTAYAESLFLLTIAMTFLFLQRGNFLSAGVTGLLTSLTRPTGIFILVAYVINAVKTMTPSWSKRLKLYSPAILILCGIGLYMFYLYFKFGNPLVFAQAQNDWGRTAINPFFSLYQAIKAIVTVKSYDVAYLMNLVNTITVIGAILLSIAIWRKNRPVASFCLLTVLTPLVFSVAATPTVSIARQVMVLFPLFIPLAQWANNRWVLLILILLFLPLNILLTILFVQWYWVV